MAITASTLLPMAPWGGQGGTLGGAVLEFPASSTDIVAGDVVIFSSGDVAVDNTPAINIVVGVALNTQATASGAVSVAPAFPGKLFEANVVTATDTDITGVFATDIGVKEDLVESAANDAGKACLDSGTTAAPVAATLFYARQRAPSAANADSRLLSGVGVTNPRVVFTFYDSWFSPTT